MSLGENDYEFYKNEKTALGNQAISIPEFAPDKFK